MNVDRHVQSLGGLEDRPEFVIIQIFAVSVRVDHGTFELEPADRTFELLRGRFRRLRRNRGERRKTLRMPRRGFAHLIIAGGRKRNRGVRLEQLHSRRG